MIHLSSHTDTLWIWQYITPSVVAAIYKINNNDNNNKILEALWPLSKFCSFPMRTTSLSSIPCLEQVDVLPYHSVRHLFKGRMYTIGATQSTSRGISVLGEIALHLYCFSLCVCHYRNRILPLHYSLCWQVNAKHLVSLLIIGNQISFHLTKQHSIMVHSTSE